MSEPVVVNYADHIAGWRAGGDRRLTASMPSRLEDTTLLELREARAEYKRRLKAARCISQELLDTEITI